MGQRLASGKRPQAKLKVMAKMGENLYRTTKIYRMMERIMPGQKAKWGFFMRATSDEHNAWKEWWNSKQSDRWKNIQMPKLEKRAGPAASSTAASSTD